MGRLVVAALVSLWVIPISIVVNAIVPDPYMDEIFHIRQAQRYCSGDFKTWDPMITTPPGLYYLSLVLRASLFPGMCFAKGIQSFPELCSTAFLRSTNAVLAIVCSVLVYDLLISLWPSLSKKMATIYSIVISLYPLHWFFTFLYYTDVASLTAVLAMYLASLRRHFFVSAMLGAFATVLRQTNVVWVVFVAACGAISFVEHLCMKDQVNLVEQNQKIEKKNVASEKKEIAVAPTLRKRKINAPMKSCQFPNTSAVDGHPVNDSGLINETVDVVFMLWYLKWNVLFTFWPYALILLAFAAFVVLNGGIVLGAKEAHLVSPHFAQLMYFGLAAAAALAPAHFTLGQGSTLYQSLRRNKISNTVKLLVSLVMGLISVHFFSIVHPYLLADNRHYTFYIWRKVIQAHWLVKYLLVPVYIYSWLSIISALGRSRRKVWVLLFCLACAAVLIPAPLVEFRYYTIPLYLLILNTRIGNMQWMAIGVLYTSVNIITMFIFLFKPFHWDNELGIQRFIW
ncbi:hypothetical protein HPP92_026578 [Vanilla planifolia]|uniref:Dol-P-Glc:Glc(2)Man(9)GlcNAc(2)-PP-Dol alpha-1,2-glucosyltransferase n=1 Tax=Vanilla planifolia TaxID=51239 RepID=A0A835PI79_VANPL|nr:hypothetical protein HPP92_026578 [Vanilla planifolia]